MGISMNRWNVARFVGSGLRPQSLALCIAAALSSPGSADTGVAWFPPRGNDHVVTTCADDGPGSLRAEVAASVSGDTIDLSGLACSQISLSSGAITIAQGSDSQPLAALQLIGPGHNALTIDGGYADRVLVHEAGDVAALTISGLTISHGFIGGDGGCIRASGSVSLTDVSVIECTADFAANRPLFGGAAAPNASLGATALRGGGLYAHGSVSLDSSLFDADKVHADGGQAFGAAIYSRGDLVLTASTISGNYARSEGAEAYGGGVFVGDRIGQVQATLSASDSRLTGNAAYSACTACPVRGGGAWVYGSATFAQSQLNGNSTFSNAQYGTGGGLYFRASFGGAPVSATLTDTDVSSNSADSDGGGIGAGGDLHITRSTVSGNSANKDGGAIGQFGGNLDIADSTLTGNIALGRGGGIFLFGYGSAGISNSTISGNIAILNGGGIANTYGSVALANSTLAFNSANGRGGGIYFRYPYYPLVLQSTIIAGNQVGALAEDIWSPGLDISGANNLVQAAGDGVGLPLDTLTADPLLQPLADNGGPTYTHALGAGSPAIDTGNNAAGLDFDQRGSGFARVSGAAADIGAFELQSAPPDDLIFADGFDL
jgi:hypothetical protein